MFFNSIDFAIFLPIVFILYWFVVNNSIKLQNTLIVVSSYIFYGWWDWRFLALILFSTIIDYSVGIALSKQKRPERRKLLLWISILVNLGFLGFFKYFNFFIDNFVAAFSFMGVQVSSNSLDIILPVGISFYTFQTLSYTIDVYRKKMEPTRDFVSFCAFVSFFPQLVAGPIERATNLLPQFYTKRTFHYPSAVNGMRQILWGLMKKILIADNCAIYANLIFNNSADYSGSVLVLGAVFFTFQIYCDFSGYSDIAIGTSKLFGFNLKRNFAFPYFSRDIAEFWRRWHISLSTWFRDYVYIPLGGSRGSMANKIRNVFIIFLVSGFWHGANWTFIVWGALNALYFIPLLLSNRNRNNLEVVAHGKYFAGFNDVLHMLLTFMMVVFAWIFFRAENIGHALSYISEIFSSSLFSVPIFTDMKKAVLTLVFIVLFMAVEWLARNKQFALDNLQNHLIKPIRWLVYLFIILTTYFFGNFSESIEFIYFQF
ncbi:MAG: MBOAT family protein [Proteobacteria bacterium]|nr:MBOAT family protein [Pseudomonadota bacterium]